MNVVKNEKQCVDKKTKPKIETNATGNQDAEKIYVTVKCHFQISSKVKSFKNSDSCMQKFVINKHPMPFEEFLENVEIAASRNTMCGTFEKEEPAEIRLLNFDQNARRWLITDDVVTADALSPKLFTPKIE